MMPILVIEDDLSTREGLLELLTMEGFTAEGVGSLGSAIEAIRNGIFALVVCDFDLGSGSGREVFEFMKTEGNATPFLLFSAGKPETAALFSGPIFFGMVRKPDTERLLAKIHEVLRITESRTTGPPHSLLGRRPPSSE